MLRLGRKTSSSNNDSRSGYLPGLDGLRALAVLAVLLYHADIAWIPGGFLGVEVFFVVSGYLITLLLLNEYRKDNRINFKNFWQRRARRLLPALFAMLAAVLVWMVLFLPDEVASIRGDVVAAFTYVTNWYLIAAQKSYFETIGRPSLLQHLWSLAVEEQFYLLWPLIFAFLLTRLKTRGALLVLMTGAALSALWMGVLYQPDADPSRVYYGTDTRAAGLLIGAALAFVWSPQPDEKKRTWRNWTLDGVGIAALGGLAFAFGWMDEFNPFLYQGGMLLVAVATAFLIAAVVHPKSPVVGPLLGFSLLQWIGLRSYSLYLWHWPVFMLTRPQLDTTLEGASLMGFRFVLTFVLAEISFRLIERPVRGGILGRLWDAWTGTHGARRWGYGITALVLLGLLLGGGAILGSAIANAQSPAQPDYVLAAPEDESDPLPLPETLAETPIEQDQNEIVSPVSSDMTSVSFVMAEDDPESESLQEITAAVPLVTDSWMQKLRLSRTPTIYTRENDFDSAFRVYKSRSQKTTRPCFSGCLALQEFREMKGSRLKPAVLPKRAAPVVAKASAPQPAVPMPVTGQVRVLAIGDSVMLGASNYLRKSVQAMLVDAKLGRQVSTAIRLLQAYKDENRLPGVVIVHLGNNGTFTANQFTEMMRVLADTPRVVFLTTKVPRKWQDPNNGALVQGARLYPNVQVIDWNSASALHPEWFWKDGIHLRPEGAQFYANLIALALEHSPYQ